MSGNAERAREHLAMSQHGANLSDWQRDNDAQLGQGYALLAIADALDELGRDIGAAVVRGEARPEPTEADPDVTIVIDRAERNVVWSAPWRTEPFVEYVPARYLQSAYTVRAVTL